MKKIVMALMMTWVCLSVFAFDIPERPNPPKLVNDYIGLLQPNQIQALETKLVEFNNKTSIQIAIVILDDLGGEDAKVVVDQLGDKWGVGQEGLNNGIVFMIVKYSEKALENMTEQKHGDWQIAVGDGLGEYLTDLEATNIGDEVFIPYAKSDEYYKGIDETVNTMLQKLGPIGWEQRQAFIKKKEAERAEATREFLNGLLMTAIIIGIIVLITVLVIVIRRSYLKKKEIRERRASLKKSFDENNVSYKRLLGMITSMGNGYPDWAKTRHEEIVRKINSDIKVSCEEVLKRFPEVVETNLVLASKYVGQFTDVVDQFESMIAQLDQIPAEVDMYNLYAPAVLKTTQDTWNEFSSKIQNKQKQGYKLLDYQKQSEGFKNDLSNIDTKLKLGNEESKYVYETSKTTNEAIHNVWLSMQTYLQNQESTKTIIASLTSDINQIPTKRAAAQKILDTLKAECPKENWEDLDKLFGGVTALLSLCSAKKEEAEVRNGMDIQDFTTAKSMADEGNEKMQRIENLFQDIQERKDEIINAKANYASMLKSAKTAISSASSKCSDSDVESGAKNKLAEAQKKLKSAEAKATESLINWLACIVLLTAAKSFADEAYSMAENDIEEAENERARVAAAAVAAAAAAAAARRSESYHSSSSSSSSTSFSGFGGGSFGGGGGGGSW
jgi:uncharacterized membrane protein YgcG